MSSAKVHSFSQMDRLLPWFQVYFLFWFVSQGFFDASSSLSLVYTYKYIIFDDKLHYNLFLSEPINICSDLFCSFFCKISLLQVYWRKRLLIYNRSPVLVPFFLSCLRMLRHLQYEPLYFRLASEILLPLSFLKGELTRKIKLGYNCTLLRVIYAMERIFYILFAVFEKSIFKVEKHSKGERPKVRGQRW